MTTQSAVSEKTAPCPWRNEEVAFVASVDFSLIRDACLQDLGPGEFLSYLTRPQRLQGQLWWHLERNPQNCKFEMVKLLDKRMEKADKCLKFQKLLAGGLSVMDEIHLKRCPFCQRDLRQIKAKLPYYAEFYEEHSRPS